MRCRPRASTPSTSTTTSRPVPATTARDSTAACARAERATCSSSGSSPASAATSPTRSTPCRPCRPRRGSAGAHRARRADRHHHRDTTVSALCRKLGITPVTLYRYVGPQGQLREQGKKVLAPRIGARQRGRVGVRTSCDRPRGGLLWAARVSRYCFLPNSPESGSD